AGILGEGGVHVIKRVLQRGGGKDGDRLLLRRRWHTRHGHRDEAGKDAMQHSPLLCGGRARARRCPAAELVIGKRPTRKRRSGTKGALTARRGHGTRLAASQLDAKAVSIYPFVPAKAGTQPLALDSRLRGNERKRVVR